MRCARFDAHLFQGERYGHTLQPTAIANKAYLHLVGSGGMGASGRTHFLGIVAKVIWRVLVDNSRQRDRRKRGGDLQRVDLDEDQLLLSVGGSVDLVDLDRAMAKLEKIDAAAVAIVELKFLGGLTVDEIAAYMEISTATVSRRWHYARAWLRVGLQQVHE